MKRLSTTLILLTAICCLATDLLQAQTTERRYMLTGVVADTTRQAIDLATVTLISARDSLIVTGVVSNTDGRFEIKNLVPDNYLVRVTHMSYLRELRPITITENDRYMDTIFMKPAVIDEVVVRAKFLERRADRFTVTMINNPIAKGRTLSGVLGLLPGVTNFNGLKIHGRIGTEVYINGRKVRNLGELSAIQAEHVEKVEVIPMAGAAYSADNKGGIIRITLRKMAEGGYFGSVSANTTIKGDGFTNWSISSPFSYRYKGFSLYNYISYQNPFNVIGRDERQSHYLDTDTKVNSSAKNHFNNWYFSDNLSLVYDLNQRHSVGLNLQVGISNLRPLEKTLSRRYDSDDLLENTSAYTARGLTKNRTYQAALNYIWNMDDKGSTLTVVADYLKNRNVRRKDYKTIYDWEDGLTQTDIYRDSLNNESDMFEGDIRAEWELGEESYLEAGLHYYYQQIKRKMLYEDFKDNDWVEDPLNSDHFRYRGDGYAGYVNFASAFGRFQYNAGLRFQMDNIRYLSRKTGTENKRSYPGFFPTATIAYELGKESENMISLTYDRGRNDVPYNYLTPEIIYESEYRYSKGNLDVKPTSWDEIELSFSYKNNWEFYYYVTHYKDMIDIMTFADEQNPEVQYTMPVNTDDSWSHGVGLWTRQKIAKWWTMTLNANSSYLKGIYMSESYDRFKTEINMENTLRFGKNWGGNVRLFWESPSRTSIQEKFHSVTYVTAGMYKFFWKNRFVGRINVTPYGRMRRTTVHTNNYHSHYENTTRYFSVTLGLSYNFKHGKQSTVKQSRTIQTLKENPTEK
jgi:hypothetical protein